MLRSNYRLKTRQSIFRCMLDCGRAYRQIRPRNLAECILLCPSHAQCLLAAEYSVSEAEGKTTSKYLPFSLQAQNLPSVPTPSWHHPPFCTCQYSVSISLNGYSAKSLLHECITLASASHRIPVQINKFQFTKRLKDLLDIGFREVEMQGADI